MTSHDTQDLYTPPPGKRAYNPAYSRIIRRVRLILPILALIIVGVIFTWGNMNDTRVMPVQNQNQNQNQGQGQGQTQADITKNELTSPRFESRDEKAQPYTITADRATQSRDQDDLIELENPVGDILLNDGHWLALKAQSGRFSQDSQHLDLTGNVQIFHDAGYQMNTEKLFIDLKANHATSDAMIEGHGPAGTLKATGLKADRTAQTLRFFGPARLTLNLQKDNGDAFGALFSP